MRYKVIIQYFNFVSMTVERRPEMDREYRWKWLAHLMAFGHNSVGRGCLGMYTAHVVYVAHDPGVIEIDRAPLAYWKNRETPLDMMRAYIGGVPIEYPGDHELEVHDNDTYYLVSPEGVRTAHKVKP